MSSFALSAKQFPHCNYRVRIRIGAAALKRVTGIAWPFSLLPVHLIATRAFNDLHDGGLSDSSCG
jgi:hypothetical protein